MPIIFEHTNYVLPPALSSWPTTAGQTIKAYATALSLLSIEAGIAYLIEGVKIAYFIGVSLKKKNQPGFEPPTSICQCHFIQSQALPILSASFRKDESNDGFLVSIGPPVWVLEGNSSRCMARRAKGVPPSLFQGILPTYGGHRPLSLSRIRSLVWPAALTKCF